MGKFKMTREKMIANFYNQYNEDIRLIKSRHGQLEYATTMYYIHKFVVPNSEIVEIGAGTGRYAVALAKEGHNVTAVELVDKNLEVLKSNAAGLNNITAFKADAVDLSELSDDTFDLTLSLGPFYHLYTKEDVGKAIDEALRITKKGGIIMCAFLSIYAIMDSNYMYGRWQDGLKENFDEKFNVRHFKEQLFTGYDICEFEALFKNKNVEYITTVGLDGSIEALEDRQDFSFTDEDFNSYIKWHLNFAEKRELLGRNNHLLLICRKK